jgi:tetratricopeptide (TPR) repeat protein
MGIPAVVGMQLPVSDPAAVAFSSQFYAALAEGLPVDAAVTEGRKAVFALRREAEWGTPVLYLCASDAQLFEIEPEPEAVRLARRISAFEAAAQAAKQAERFEDEIVELKRLLEIDPGHSWAAARLREAGRQVDLAWSFRQGQEHFDAGRWDQALSYFGRVADLARGDPRYRTVHNFIVTARRRLAESTLTLPASDGPSIAAAPSAVDDECSKILRRFLDSKVVVILGSAANLIRCRGARWSRSPSTSPPSKGWDRFTTPCGGPSTRITPSRHCTTCWLR